MTLYSYSYNDSFLGKTNESEEIISLEKSMDNDMFLTQHLDALKDKFEFFLKSFPMSSDEQLIEKTEKIFTHNGLSKNTAKSLWLDRAVQHLAMNYQIPKEALYVVKSVMEKGGSYRTFLTPKSSKKCIKYFKDTQAKK